MIDTTWRQPAKRLQLRQITQQDTDFVIALVNDPMWITHIGDRNVHNQQQALEFIQQGPEKSYQDKGFGMYVFESVSSFEPMGLCGLLQRDYLEYPDIGYAILPQFRGQGLTFDACCCVLEHDLAKFELTRLHAMVSPDNLPSIALIEKLGFQFARLIEHDVHQSLLYRQDYP